MQIFIKKERAMKNFKLMIMMAMIVPAMMYGKDKNHPDKERVLIINNYGAAIYVEGESVDKLKNDHLTTHTIEADKSWVWIAKDSDERLKGFKVIDSKEEAIIMGTGLLTFGTTDAAVEAFKTKQKIENGNNVFTLTAGPVIKSSTIKKVIVTPSKASTAVATNSTSSTTTA